MKKLLIGTNMTQVERRAAVNANQTSAKSDQLLLIEWLCNEVKKIKNAPEVIRRAVYCESIAVAATIVLFLGAAVFSDQTQETHTCHDGYEGASQSRPTQGRIVEQDNNSRNDTKQNQRITQCTHMIHSPFSARAFAPT